MRVRTRVLGGAAAVAALSGGSLAVVSGGASARSQPANQRVIVVFNNQDAANPATRAHIAARRSSFAGTQNPIVAQMRTAGAHDIRAYTILDAVSATVSSSEAATLKADPAVSEVIPDQIVPVGSSSPSVAAASLTGSGARSHSVRGHAVRPHAVSASAAGCSTNPNQPELTPEALGLIHANSTQPGAQTAASLGITGAGVKVAYIADGLNPNNPDFIRANGQHVFVDYKDFTGEGTSHVTGGEEAFGDAASIAAQGRETYNVEGYGPNAVQTPCYIRIEGVAPGASLVGEDIFGANNAGYASSIIDAINYAVTTDRVNVLNESFGSNYYPDDQATLDLIKQADDNAVAAGTTVTVSTGDAGATSTFGSPSTDPAVISSGATTSYQSDLQDGYGGAQFPGITGYLDDNISSFSSGGYGQQGQTTDTVAPGELNWSLCSTKVKTYEDCENYAGKPTAFVPFGGTSESSPLTAGAAALVYQAYMKTHGTYPSPAVVKDILASTSTDIDAPADQQGTGLINAYKAVQAAESYSAPGSSGTPTGQSLLKSSTQINVVDQPNTPESLTDTVTNDGSATEHVAVSGRQLGAYTPIPGASQTLTLSDASSPKTTNWAGVPGNYQKVTFTVPAGENRLDAAAAFQQGVTNNTDPTLAARVRITLVDPDHRLASYSVPQGDGNHTDVQVTNPVAGTWTAYVWSNEGADGGTQGPVQFGASVAQFTSFGSVSPSTLTLAPGQSAPVTLSLTTPQTPGDSAGSLVFSGTGASASALGTSTVPVTVRSLIPNGNQSFQQTLVGGNGRETTVGQEFYYQLDVGANQPELNAAIELADNPNNPFTAFLVGPNGEAQAVGANELPNGSGSSTPTNELGAQLHVLDPAQGAWTLIVAFAPTVSGTTLTEPFTVSTNESAVPVSTSGGSLPDSASTQLTPGQPTTVTVDVTNNGPSPAEYFADGRLSTTTQLPLAAFGAGGPNTVVPLTTSQNVPTYLVPTDSSGFTASATTTGTTPIEFDTESPAGDPDILGPSSGASAGVTFSGDPLSQGLWDIAPDVTGAYGATPAANEPVATSMSVTTQAFDPAVTSPDGDLWLASSNPAALESLSPVLVQPGKTAQIPVTITPKGPAGSTVTGTLYVDDEDSILFDQFIEPNGNQVGAIPYEYTIK